MKLNNTKIAMLFMSFILVTNVQSAPIYESKETKNIIESMVKAHGGLEIWKNAPSISYDNIMHNNYHGKQEFAWWVAHEVIDQKTRQVYQKWPYDKAQIGYDDKQVWSRNWKRANPPSFMVSAFYYFVNLPWLTQDDGVILSKPTKFKWPGTEIELIEIKMTFKQDPAIGKTNKDYYVLYINPVNYRLTAYQYAIGYKPLLKSLGQPEDLELFGPLWRYITKYEEVDGLLFPSAFRTMPEANERIVGNHLIMNIDINQKFDYEKAKAPKDADIEKFDMGK